MKKIVIISCCILLFSCKAHKTALSPFVAIYKSDQVGNVAPEYILLRSQPKFFEKYSPNIYESSFGQWDISNDTLFIFPKFEYFSRNSELKLSEMTPQDTSVMTIPQQYLIKNDCLIDITDYDPIYNPTWQGFFNKSDNKTIYKRVKH